MASQDRKLSESLSRFENFDDFIRIMYILSGDGRLGDSDNGSLVPRGDNLSWDRVYSEYLLEEVVGEPTLGPSNRILRFRGQVEGNTAYPGTAAPVAPGEDMDGLGSVIDWVTNNVVQA